MVYNNLFKHVKLVGHADMYRCYKPVLVYKEPEFPYRALPEPSDGNIIIKGYFQSYRYFDAYRAKIRDTLLSNEHDRFQLLKSQYIERHARGNGRPTVCVHVRRGDYLERSDYHLVLPPSYYEKSIAHVKSSLAPIEPVFVVFSDDVHHVKSWSMWTGIDAIFEEDMDTLNSLFRMSLCDHFIVANSSFSLNAYYLRHSEDAVLCAPSRWFGERGPAHTIHDLVPPTAAVFPV